MRSRQKEDEVLPEMNGPAAVAFKDDLVQAWKEACEKLTNPNAVDYVLVTGFGSAWQGTSKERHAIDTAAKQVGAELPSSVASMLLPKIVRASTQQAAAALDRKRTRLNSSH